MNTPGLRIVAMFPSMLPFRLSRFSLVLIVVSAVVALSGGTAQAHAAATLQPAIPAAPLAIRQVKLDADQSGQAQRRDTRLVNPWGITFMAVDPVWIADNGTGLATEYNGHGVATGAAIRIPPPSGSAKGTTAAPTGVVFNSSKAFIVKRGKVSAPSELLFATEEGTIAGWNPHVNGSHAIIAIDHSHVPSANAGAVYKGLALGRSGRHWYLYAANFRAARIDVFDASFHTARLAGSFHDSHIPSGYAPFNIANLGGSLYVTYAKQNGEKHDDVAGAGNGFVDVYSTNGVLLRRLIAHGHLDSPWGLAIAPASFPAFRGDLLVGNFGNGRINAYSPTTGAFRGTLANAKGAVIVTSGLWGLAFGDGSASAPRSTLYFTAGVDDEQHGLFGDLTLAA